MTYTINKSDGTPLVNIEDNSINTTATSLALIGRNAVNFGQSINQNFVNLLQNFANQTAPAYPLPGQLWYDPVIGGIRVYQGENWSAVVPPFDGVSGTATVRIGPSNMNVVLTISNNKIVSVTCHSSLIAAFLPDYVIVNDSRYNFKQFFPNGLLAGINLSVDPEVGYQFIGSASSANVLTIPRTINLTGDLEGSAVFDGSSNINIDASFSNIYINGNSNVTVAGTYTKIVVDAGGRIIGGGNISNGDVIAALGYVPYSGANVNVSAQGNTLVARDENGNFAANIMVGTATAAYALKDPVMVAINGDVVGAASFDGSNSITITTTLSPISNLTPGTYSTVRVDNKGRVVSGSATGDTPVGAIIGWNIATVIPAGWARANGQSVTTPSGEVVTTPNLSAIGIGTTSNFYIMKVY